MREYHKAMDKRMFDFEAFYLDMAMWMPQESVIAEVGVAEGASTVYLAETLLNLGKSFTFYAIDNLAYGQDGQLRTLMKNIGQANLGHLVEIVPVSSVEGACRFPDLHFDFVFIDASHKIEWTKADILLWYQKLKVGGVLAGHDYNTREGWEVKMAVDAIIPKSIRDENENKISTTQIIPTEKSHNVWKVTKLERLKLKTY